MLPNAGRSQWCSETNDLNFLQDLQQKYLCHSCGIVGHKILPQESTRDSLGGAGGAARAARGSACAEMHTKPKAVTTSLPGPVCPHFMAIGTAWLSITLLQNSWNTCQNLPLFLQHWEKFLLLTLQLSGHGLAAAPSITGVHRVQEARTSLAAESCLAGEELKLKSNSEILELLNRP